MCGILLDSKRRQDVLARADIDRMHLQHTWLSQVRDFSSHAQGMKNTLCYPPSKENKLNQVLLIYWLAPHAIKYKDGARRKRVPSLVMLSCLCAPTRICPSLSCQEVTSPLGELPCEYSAVLLRSMGSSFRFSHRFLESLPGDLQAEAAAAPVSRP